MLSNSGLPMWLNGPSPGQFYNFMAGNTETQLPRELTTAGPYGTKHST